MTPNDEWQDLVESQEDRKQTSEPATRKHTTRKAAPSPLPGAARGQRPLHRDRAHVKRPRPGRWKGAAFSALFFFLTYVLEILRIALVLLRKPLSLIVVGYLLAVLVSHLQHTFTKTLRSTFDPLCFLPGISRMAICYSPHPRDLSAASPGPRDAPKHADYPALVNIQSETFEQLLDESVGGAGLALEIKKAEMATSDLTTLVRVSSLTSKDKIAETLDTFVEGARGTARGLQRFSAKVGGAVDGVIAINDYALQQIEVASADSFSTRWLSIWFPFSYRSTSLAAVKHSFTQAMATLESELHILILAAEASLHDLDILEEHLRLLHTIVLRENHSLSTSKQELLSSLWTLVGGNRAELHRYETHLKLLSGLSGYRRKALAHVVGALQTLQKMSAELEVLRERVSQPVMLGDMVPLEVHVKSIKAGLDRLMEGKLKAKRIEDARYAKLLAPLER